MREAWEAEAGNWMAWARAPGHDSQAALGRAGLAVERLVEVPDATAPPDSRPQRLPLFLDFRAVRR